VEPNFFLRGEGAAIPALGAPPKALAPSLARLRLLV
jgi:hypothetical protein